MAELRLYNHKTVDTVFDLLGDKEDDITYSLGWGLANSDELARAMLSEAFTGGSGEVTAIRLQQTLPGAGRTDVEIESEHHHLIIEAKRGWTVPTPAQLEQYAARFHTRREGCIAVVAECSPEWATPRLPAEVAGVPVRYLPWSRVAQVVEQTAARAGAGNAEKRLLRELVRYLRGLMTMQNVTSNMVYVVSLGLQDLFGSGVSFADIVVKHGRYFHPMGGGAGGWPKEPPNYLGFRFHGKLQHISHVESYDVHQKPWEDVPALSGKPDWPEGQHFVYELGPEIVPSHEVRTGNLYRAQRVWVALDLLLTCNTVLEARDKTSERLAAVGGS
jgi:hypothetical protein